MSGAAYIVPADIFVDVESPALASLRLGAKPGEWAVPVEMVIALTSEAQRTVIRWRRSQGENLQPNARVFLLDGRFFAEVRFYGPGQPGLLFSLSLWPDLDRESGSRRGRA